MVVVAVAGGTGDLGRLIVDSLLKREQHEVYVISRRVSSSLFPVKQTSPINLKEELRFDVTKDT